MNEKEATRLVLDELRRASGGRAFESDHEGYAVLLEEVDELWSEIKTNPRNAPAVRDECVQVAAMALRFLMDLCPSPEGARGSSRD